MRIIKETSQVPENSIITENFPGLVDYIDSFSIRIKNLNNDTVDYLAAKLFTSWPPWAGHLLTLRNVLVKPFGLETGPMPVVKAIDPSVYYPVGERAVFFTVIDRNTSEIVMAEDDSHLYFRTSLFIDQHHNKGFDTVHMTTLVRFHNRGGRFYFLIIKPFHKWIIKVILKNMFQKESPKGKSIVT